MFPGVPVTLTLVVGEVGLGPTRVEGYKLCHATYLGRAPCAVVVRLPRPLVNVDVRLQDGLTGHLVIENTRGGW